MLCRVEVSYCHFAMKRIFQDRYISAGSSNMGTALKYDSLDESDIHTFFNILPRGS